MGAQSRALDRRREVEHHEARKAGTRRRRGSCYHGAGPCQQEEGRVHRVLQDPVRPGDAKMYDSQRRSKYMGNYVFRLATHGAVGAAFAATAARTPVGASLFIVPSLIYGAYNAEKDI